MELVADLWYPACGCSLNSAIAVRGRDPVSTKEDTVLGS